MMGKWQERLEQMRAAACDARAGAAGATPSACGSGLGKTGEPQDGQAGGGFVGFVASTVVVTLSTRLCS